MNPKAKAILAVVSGLVVIGGGAAVWYFGFRPASEDEVDKLIDAANESGSDMMGDMTPQKKARMVTWFKKLNQIEIRRLINLLKKGERNWKSKDKSDFTRLIEKARGKKLQA